MIYAFQGRVNSKGDGFLVIQCGGIFFKVFVGRRTIQKVLLRKETKVYTAMYLRQDEQPELFGFLKEEELKLFELLKTISGIGPRTALKILDLGTAQVKAAIAEKKPELIARIPGVGRKTADRAVSELQNKIKVFGSKAITKTLEMDEEIEGVLVGLGFQRRKARDVIAHLGKTTQKLEERLKKALREVSK